MTGHRSYRLKFDRACHHLDTLERAERGDEPNAYLLVNERDPDGSGHVVGVELNYGFFGCLIGDVIHNFRCALDHLALELALANTNPLPTGYEDSSEFPIFGCRPMSDKAKNRIRSIAPVAQTIIQRLQPHLRGKDYGSDPLWQLHELDNIDKHRRIHLIELRGTKIGLGGQNVEVSNIQMLGKREEVESGAIVAGYQASPADPQTEMHVNLRLEGEVAFDQVSPLPGQLVVPVLQSIRDHLQQHVFIPLEAHL